MPDPMSVADLAKQHVELLPARTVLSLWRADLGGDASLSGESGSHGADGQSISGFSLFSVFGHGLSGSSGGDAGSKNG
jgi:hypothetical protein